MIDGFDTVLRGGIIALVLSVPLAVWKLVEVAIWLLQHVHIK